MDFDLSAILQSFVAESEEQLAEVEQALIAGDHHRANTEAVQAFFRAAHTLKGNATALGFPSLAAYAHAVEEELDALRAAVETATPEVVSALLTVVDAMREMVPRFVSGEMTEPTEGHLAAVDSLRRRRVTGNVAAAPEAPQAPGQTQHAGALLRIPVGKLNRMLDLTGEIAIAHGRVRNAMRSAGVACDADTVAAYEEVDRLFLDLQEQVMRLRMVPLGPAFRHLARAVRDLSRAQGKQTHFEVHGEDVELDTTMVQLIRDPLLHMVRNAVDHGVEIAEERVAVGKPATAKLVLSARNEAGAIVIELADDGRGIDRERVLERAVAAGIVRPNEQLSPAAIDSLIFESGLSTTDQVTDVSGRGVGMDVVRRNVESLRGSVGVRSEPGLGCTVTIRLPLTLAVVEAFLVESAGGVYLIPLEVVCECVPADGLSRDGEATGLINLRGEALPVVRLDTFTGGTVADTTSVVVVSHAGQRVGVAVQRLLGQSQAVLKPLGTLFRDVELVSGATILGDGRVALILDVPTLVHKATAQAVSEESAIFSNSWGGDKQ